MPEDDYPVFKVKLATANKYGEVMIDRVAVHVPDSYHYNKLYLITYWNHFKVISSHGEILSEGPRPYMNQTREIPWQSILKNWMGKPRSVIYSRCYPYLPDRIAHYLSIELMKLRKDR